jgi:hypothetical protein
MRNVKCITCDDFLSEHELPENKPPAIPLPGIPLPEENECFICYVRRADADGPENLNYPTHMKEHNSTMKMLEGVKKKRRLIN